jgi:uncharacterized protein YceH (UPF0502 family)
VELLTQVEVRVLGALIEKAITTPDNYPLSLNALTIACNQSSNRDPVAHYDDQTVADAIDTLRGARLVHIVQRSDSRVTRYRQVVDETWGLDSAETAVMDVLMLRGPQTVGEVRTRSMRLHDFRNLDQVASTLNALIVREPDGFVSRLGRQPGQKEVRYFHRLSGEVSTDPVGATDPDLPDPGERLTRLEESHEELRGQVDDLRNQLEQFRKQFE